MEPLHSLRDIGVLPTQAGDAGDRRIRAILAAEIERAGRDDLAPAARQARHPVRARLRDRRQRTVALAAAGLLIAMSGVAAAAGLTPWSLLSSGSATNLFTANPSQVWSQSGMSVIASSVTDLGTISVPGVGDFQFWGGQTQNGKWCMAFKAPDDLWAGTASNENGAPGSAYNFSGVVPGCGAYANTPQGGGFHWSIDDIGPTIADNNSATVNALSAVIFGAIDDPGTATRVIDATTGASTPILGGHYFALVFARRTLGTVQLQAVDSTGNVIRAASFEIDTRGR